MDMPLNKPERSNILLIVMDTVRADHLATWGYRRNTMPNMDKLCKSSFVFKQAISPLAGTIPTPSSLFTSDGTFSLTRSDTYNE